jgi:4-amino-4-deoxy-L-arabinose transferase-like glycosyltransferase
VEAAGALGRWRPASFRDQLREAVRARSRAFWIVAGLTVLAAGLRFATLGVQSYHHDEIVTASRVLRGSFGHAMDVVGFSESAPPLYYVLAWLWVQVVGTGEFGLRSLSALAGIATVPVVYLIGLELRGRRAGILAAALAAVNPMLVWYSQEARSYSLLVLFGAVAALYFVRALERGRRSDILGWGVASALALATHYFAIFPILIEGAWLLRRRGRAVVAGAGIVVATGVALAPLAIHQTLQGHADWIGDHSLGHRLWEVAATFAVGETGEVIAQPERLTPAIVPLAAIAAALALLAARAERDERRAAGRMLAIVAFTVAAPLAIAVLHPAADFVLARNLIPALVPLLVAIAIAATVRRARRAGIAVAAVLLAYSLGFTVLAGTSPSLQRVNWESVADRLGEPRAPRAIVTWTLGQASLRHYLSTGSFQVRASEEFPWYVHEIEFISDGDAPPVPRRLLGPGFTAVAYESVGALRIRRYALPGPDVARLRLRKVDDARLNFGSNTVLLDGIGPG